MRIADKYSTGSYLPTLVRQIKKFDLKKQPEKFYVLYSGRGKFMPLPLKSKILETPGFLVTDYIKMFPL
jgi:hypothetical protein